MTLFLTALLRPFAALVFLLAAVLLARVVMRYIPEGRLKRILSLPVGGKR